MFQPQLHFLQRVRFFKTPVRVYRMEGYTRIRVYRTRSGYFRHGESISYSAQASNCSTSTYVKLTYSSKTSSFRVFHTNEYAFIPYVFVAMITDAFIFIRPLRDNKYQIMFLASAFVLIITIPCFVLTLQRTLSTLLRQFSYVFVVLNLTVAVEYTSIGSSFQLRGRIYHENAYFILTDSSVSQRIRRIQSHDNA